VKKQKQWYHILQTCTFIAIMKEHINTLDFLRGIAALGIVSLHFTLTSLMTIEPNLLTDIFFYGRYGVHVFFVISGFIIPYSMVKSNYIISDYFNYLSRRFVRICLPSYASILLTFLLYYTVVLILGRQINNFQWPEINFTSIIGNLTYTVPYLDTLWFNPVYWTLAIEFQFYLIIGLILPLILKKNHLLTLSLLIIPLILGRYIPVQSFFTYASFFILGICLFLKKEKLLPNKLNYLLLFITLYSLFLYKSYAALIFALIAFFVLLSEVKIDTKYTNFLGKISYSIYITHYLMEILFEVFAKRFIDIHLYPIGRFTLLLIYLPIVILFSTLFYKYVEQPFTLYSKKLKKSR